MRRGLVLHRGTVAHRLLRFSHGSGSGGFRSSGHRSVALALAEAKMFLPHQPILENFVHHNPFHHLESMRFDEAVKFVGELERYVSPGARAADLVRVDPRKRVNEALVDLSSVFLDRGAAKWTPSERDRGFLFLFASLENLGFAPWREYARTAAVSVLGEFRKGKDALLIAQGLVEESLACFGVPRHESADCIRVMMLELKGWAGMFCRMEEHPEEAPPSVPVRLLEFYAVQCLLTRSSLEAVARQSGDWDDETPLSTWLDKAPRYRDQESDNGFTSHASAVAYLDQSWDRREAMEKRFQQTLMHAVGSNLSALPGQDDGQPQLQVYTCIDDRSCSLRRHVEAQASPGGSIETFGVAGFFGIPIKYRPADGREQMILAPEGQNPTAVLVEDIQKRDPELAMTYQKRRKILAGAEFFWEKASFSPFGSLLLSAVAPFSLARLLLMGFSPISLQRVRELTHGAFIPKPPVEIQLPFPPDHAATLLARTFKDIGAHRRFSPIVFVLGHGSMSTNNPFSAAYNCGACGGREGGPNARLLARLANDPAVRHHLRADHGIRIPDGTHFVGGRHNTTTDRVEFFDIDKIPESHVTAFQNAEQLVELALGRNALERSARFLLAHNVNEPQKALKHVYSRAVDYAEVRPELNHATNAAVVVGRRVLTRGHFLDRRVFLPSYDPHSDDDAGTNLEHVLAPALIVCSGINLEYLFSTVNQHLGAGTKAPLNIVGNVGVLQGTAGDLKPGLPSQMTEMHVPLRALYVVDAPVARVEAVFKRRDDLSKLVRNEWVHMIVRDPNTGQFFEQSRGKYIPIREDGTVKSDYVPLTAQINHGLHVAKREEQVYWASLGAMGLACALPVSIWGASAMNPHGSLIAISGTLLALPVLAFSRRYLHGEFMFSRFAFLCVGLLSGFNLVATSPSLAFTMAAWSLFGFSSTFLIGAYNERPTVRNNATFAFAAYHISDLAMLVATTFTAPMVASQVENAGPLVAGSLLVAAIFKSSQFPLTSLFVRSMEGPTPASALGYAGLSAHVGVVLLTSTMPLWFEYDWARMSLASIGLITAVYSNLVAKVRSDRKGAVANATSATIGLIYAILALGHWEMALLLSLGHAAFRMIQILRSPNTLNDTQHLRSALGSLVWPRAVPSWLYHVAWTLRRLKSDFHLIHVLHWMSRKLQMPKSWKPSKAQQWFLTSVGVVLAGLPYTPVTHVFEETVMELLPEHPIIASSLMLAHFGFSVMVIRFLFLNVLSTSRWVRPK